MQSFGILFIIFGSLVFLMGIYFYTGHFNKEIFWQAYWKNMTKRKLKNVGIGTFGMSAVILLTGFSALFFEEENIIPLIVCIISFIIMILIVRKLIK